ncbi:hypothetical protein K432DRAFT_299721, partial [Lepidopterella palustris CBS 459.81]
LLIKPRQGFTGSLQLYTKEKRTKKANLIAIINGPYSKELDFTRFETILLFATRINITRQLSYLKRLIEIKNRRATSIKRISLYWEIEYIGKKYQLNIKHPLIVN